MERKLTAILSADVEGYSRLMGEDEEATIRTLTSYRQVMTTLIHGHGNVLPFGGCRESPVAFKVQKKATLKPDLG
jgi:class 3 adenylate cyclase